MSLLGYQQALCDMIASPQLCLRVRDGAGALDGYALTAREQGRLRAVSAQRGMSANCTLYRVNRITPLQSYLPLTCTLLGDRLVEEADQYWSEGKPGDLQFGPEALRFGQFLRRRLRAGAIDTPYLAEVVALEMAANELRWGAQPASRSVRFAHDPVALLEALADGRPPGPDITRGDYTVLLDAAGGRLRLGMVATSGG